MTMTMILTITITMIMAITKSHCWSGCDLFLHLFPCLVIYCIFYSPCSMVHLPIPYSIFHIPYSILDIASCTLHTAHCTLHIACSLYHHFINHHVLIQFAIITSQFYETTIIMIVVQHSIFNIQNDEVIVIIQRLVMILIKHIDEMNKNDQMIKWSNENTKHKTRNIRSFSFVLITL
jgi:hypothetical protein